MKEGHASPRLISKANVCVDDQTAQQSSSKRSTPNLRKDVWREKRLREKGLRVRMRKRGLEPQ